MRYVLWIVKFALFVLAFTFVVKNTDTVVVRYFLGHEWRAPLSIVLFAFFCVGAVLGLLGAQGKVLRQRREISSLKRELQGRGAASREPPPPDLAGL